MKQLFQENRNALIILLGLLFILLFVVFLFFYRPLAGDLAEKEAEEESLMSDLAILEQRLITGEKEGTNDLDELDAIRLQGRLPSEEKLDELILILNEIELVSGSLVNSISFGYSGSLPDSVIPQEEESNNEPVDLEKEIEERLNPETSEEEGSIQLTEKPAGLEPIQVTLNVESPDYQHFQLFLKEIEKQERMMIVSSLSFDKPAEEELIFSEEPDETISATVTIMTFYYDN